jgi:hypothetical protein
MQYVVENAGITDEQYCLFCARMREPVFTWEKLRWFPCTVESNAEHKYSERADASREEALRGLRDFLSEYPQVPIAGLRAMIAEVVNYYYSFHGMANPEGRQSNITSDINLFIDAAFVFFQERANQSTVVSTGITGQRSDTGAAVSILLEPDS